MKEGKVSSDNWSKTVNPSEIPVLPLMNSPYLVPKMDLMAGAEISIGLVRKTAIA